MGENYFKPIVIDNLCAIHSSFHKDVPECKYDILIDPKMAFGTGHHATTTLILRRLLSMDLAGKKVVDMGTGTGILAILADMRGAAHIDAVEIDEFAYENAKENVQLNGATHIDLHLGDASTLAESVTSICSLPISTVISSLPTSQPMPTLFRQAHQWY